MPLVPDGGRVGHAYLGIKSPYFTIKALPSSRIWTEFDSIRPSQKPCQSGPRSLTSNLVPASLPEIIRKRRTTAMQSRHRDSRGGFPYARYALASRAAVHRHFVSLVTLTSYGGVKGGSPGKPFLDAHQNASQSYKEAEATLES